MLRSVDPSQGRVHTASRYGPSSDALAVGCPRSTQIKCVK